MGGGRGLAKALGGRGGVVTARLPLTSTLHQRPFLASPGPTGCLGRGDSGGHEQGHRRV